MRVAIVHDYLTQRGGGERVVLSMLRAFPDAPVYTSFYEPSSTLAGFSEATVYPLPMNRIGALRRHHRAALPLLAPSFSALKIEADVVICSSAGWSHGIQTSGRKLVYCHSPARWLYHQADRYIGEGRPLLRAGLRAMQPALRSWDRKAAQSADRYVVNSTAIRETVRKVYGIDAEVLPPPHSVNVHGPQETVDMLEPGYLLCVSRLLPYKNVDTIVDAFRALPQQRLVVVGAGPQLSRLTAAAGPNVRFLGAVSEDQIRWLYANCAGLVAASYEDYGLTPLEAASFAKPVAVLRWGGFLDTVAEGQTGVYFDEPEPEAISTALRTLLDRPWDERVLLSHARKYDEVRFTQRLQQLALEERAAA